MKNVILIILIAFALTDCNSLNSKNKSENLYSAKTEKLKNGFLLTITPAKGFKWNKEYPFKLIISESHGAYPEKKEYKKSDVKTKDHQATLEIDCKDNSCVGKKDIIFKGKMNFSICNDTQCKIFRNKEIEIKTTPEK